MRRKRRNTSKIKRKFFLGGKGVLVVEVLTVRMITSEGGQKEKEGELG